MFNDRFLLTQAVLDGRKTQTRRLINPQPYYDENVGMVWKGYASGRGTSDYEEPQASYRNFVHHSKYKVGEIVAVAQRYSECGAANFDEWERNSDWFEKGFSNKMFVKPELMPYQIRITNVRVQRLQDITDDECLLGGIKEEEREVYRYSLFDAKLKTYLRWSSPREAYAHLIDALSHKGTWDSNPYVFVYDFGLAK